MRLVCDSCLKEDEATKSAFLKSALAHGQVVQRDREGYIVVPDHPAGPDAFRAPLLCTPCREALIELVRETRRAALASAEEQAEVQSAP